MSVRFTYFSFKKEKKDVTCFVDEKIRNQPHVRNIYLYSTIRKKEEEYLIISYVKMKSYQVNLIF